MRRAADKMPAATEAEAPSQQQAASDVHPQAEGNGTVEKCVNCQYYDRRNAKPTDGKAPLWGQCRRHAPHLNPVTAKAYVVEGVWPLVRDDDWCGEWKVLTRVDEDMVPEAPPALPPAAPQPAAPQRVKLAKVPTPVTAVGDD